MGTSVAGETGDNSTATTAGQRLEEADSLFESRDFEKAKAAYRKAADLAEKEARNEPLTEARAQVARCFLVAGEKAEAEAWLERTEPIATPEEPLGYSRFLGVRGRLEWKSEETERAKETFREMYVFCSERELHSRAIDAAHMMGILGEGEEQIEWGKRAIAEAEAGGVEGWLPALWNNLGWAYSEEGEHEAALEALLKAREHHWRGGGEMEKLIADYSVGHAHRKVGELDTAQAWLRPCLAWAERLEATGADAGEWIGFTCWDLGEIAAERGNVGEARDYLTRALAELERAGMPDWDRPGYEEKRARVQELRKAGE